MEARAPDEHPVSGKGVTTSLVAPRSSRGTEIRTLEVLLMRVRASLFLSLVLAIAGCGDDDSTPTPVADAGVGNGDSGAADSGVVDSDSGIESDGGVVEESRFVLRIENVSGAGPLPGPIAPGVAVAATGEDILFEEGAPDRGEGLEGLAEDGAAGPLAESVDGALVFNTPVGASEAGPAFPGGAYEVEFSANPGENLHFATMVVQTNDVFLSPDGAGIALFDGDGNPLAEQDVTDQVTLWDVGTEANEAPGAGPNQAPRQSGPDTGAAEGVVRSFTGSTHALPLAQALMQIEVSESAGTYTITLENTAPDSGALLSPFAPVFWATHDDSVQVFGEGEAASDALETLAEDGSPAALVAAHDGSAGFGSVGSAGSAPVMGGESVTFDVTPTPAAPRLSFAAMLVQTNDAFFAPSSAGVALLADDGTPRPAAEVQAQLRRELALWDAGTEADQVPGVGPDQAPRQSGPNTGADDPNATVRRHGDATNLLANIEDVASVTIEANGTANGFDVTVTTSGTAEGYPILTPVNWAVHSAATSIFDVGAPASASLRAVAEDGNPTLLLAALGMDEEVASTGVQARPVGAEDNGPLMPGNSYTFSVVADSDHRFLSIATMVVPSNDLFLAFGQEGIALLDEDGNVRSDADIAADVAATFEAWDAGTEQNQSGAGGADQAPRQSAAGVGEDEGDGNVRQLPDGVWHYPEAGELVRVTVRPAE